MFVIDFDYRTYEIEKGISIEIKPLDNKNYDQILSFLSKEGITQDLKKNKEKMLDLVTSAKYKQLIKTVLTGFSKNIKGVEKKVNGKITPISVQDMIDTPQCSNWATSVFFQIFTISSLDREETAKVKK